MAVIVHKSFLRSCVVQCLNRFIGFISGGCGFPFIGPSVFCLLKHITCPKISVKFEILFVNFYL